MNGDIFEGPFAGFGKTWIQHEDRPVIPLQELLREETLSRLLMQVYGPELMPDKLPVLVSQWFKFYAMQLIPPVVVASLVKGMGWSLALDDLAFALHERGFLDGVRFESGPFKGADSADPFERFAPLLDNLQHVIEQLSAYGSLVSAVLWSSAGDYLETCLRQLAQIDGGAAGVGYGLLNQRFRSDGTRNPLFKTITYKEGPEGQAVRHRRSCCLSYRVEWVGRCEHCPLQRPPDALG